MNDFLYRELLIGCGHARDKRLGVPGDKLEWKNLVTLDINRRCKPDFVCDLNAVPWSLLDYDDMTIAHTIFDPVYQKRVFVPGYFDEVHAYEVLEHLGQQGDAEAFFDTFSEIWRVLKPNGHLFATVPSRYSGWLWGDPSHRRVILPESLVFLNQAEYIRQCDGPMKTPMSDFRGIYRADFEVVACGDNHTTHTFCLRAVKPSRWVP